MIDILRLIFLEKLVIVCVFLFSSVFQSTFASSDVLDDKPLFAATSLSSISSATDLEPEIYISDDIEQILSFPLSSFEEEDVVIFDIDQTLIIQLTHYYYAHFLKKSSLHERLMAQPTHIRDKFDAYRYVFSPYALMDEKIPSFIKKLQGQKVK